MKYVWLIWLVCMNPLGSAENGFYVVGSPSYKKPCRFDVEDNSCDPVVLSRERIRKK